MNQPLYLIYLDRYHQGDPLFLRELAQAFARAGPGQVPALLLHTSGEKLERTLEAEGLFPERREGVVQVETPEQAALAERAAREANQELVGTLTDALVTAVGLQGADRGLLRRAADGTVQAGDLGWVEDLLKMRVMPVISALAKGPGRGVEAPPARVAVALAEGLSAFDVTLCFLAKGDLSAKGDLRGEEAVPLGALPGEDALPEREAVRHAARAYAGDVLLTDLRRFFAEGGPQGTRVEDGPGDGV